MSHDWKYDGRNKFGKFEFRCENCQEWVYGKLDTEPPNPDQKVYRGRTKGFLTCEEIQAEYIHAS